MNFRTYVKELTTLTLANIVLKTSNLNYNLATVELDTAKQLVNDNGVAGLRKATKHFRKAMRHGRRAENLSILAFQIYPDN